MLSTKVGNVYYTHTKFSLEVYFTNAPYLTIFAILISEIVTQQRGAYHSGRIKFMVQLYAAHLFKVGLCIQSL